jgi:Protein of unknown function (DUF3631)
MKNEIQLSGTAEELAAITAAREFLDGLAGRWPTLDPAAQVKAIQGAVGALVVLWLSDSLACEAWLPRVCEVIKLHLPTLRETVQKRADESRESCAVAAPDNAIEESIARLAKLSALEYEAVRIVEADKLKWRVGVLDSLVAKKRGIQPTDNGGLQGRAVKIADVEPWPEPVDGADVLDKIAETFSRYLVLPPGAAEAMALWSGHTHVFRLFPCSPRLNITSPEKGCGKSVCSDVIALEVPRPLLTENLTVAVLFRLVERYAPTIIADEYDTWLPDNKELRGLFNAGHRRGAAVYRCEGDSNEVRAFAAYAPAVLCGIGSLPGTLHDRSIEIRMVRAKEGEVREQFDSRHTERETALCRKLARWCADNAARLESSDPTMPDGAYNRLADNWRPLFAVAEIAGGDWPERARRAFALLTSGEDADAQGIGAMLLADTRQAFDESGPDRLFSKELVERLVAMTQRPWGEIRKGHAITENWLAHRLKAFKVASRKIRIGADTRQGYLRECFEEAWARFTPAQGESKWNSGTTPVKIGETEHSETEQASDAFRFENATLANKDGPCSTVPFPEAPNVTKEEGTPTPAAVQTQPPTKREEVF